MPFGGLLGSTFTFVFETQMEALQNGDRFYYLARTAGLNFLTELENNSFAKLIMLEHRRDASAGRRVLDAGLHPRGRPDEAVQRRASATAPGSPIRLAAPTCARSSSATTRQTPGSTTRNYLRTPAASHVVLGGTRHAGSTATTSSIASIGDDTLWGDGGDDRLEGGDGNRQLEGGAGDDIITDCGGDDIIKGDDGNDVIHGGNGLNLIFGGAGQDFIITGEDVSERSRGAGNDFILGAQINLPTFGNEGDDWIEIGTSGRRARRQLRPARTAISSIGHDVFVGGGGFDEIDRRRRRRHHGRLRRRGPFRRRVAASTGRTTSTIRSASPPTCSQTT